MEAEAVDGRLKEAEVKEKLTIVPSLHVMTMIGPCYGHVKSISTLKPAKILFSRESTWLKGYVP